MTEKTKENYFETRSLAILFGQYFIERIHERNRLKKMIKAMFFVKF